jgi:hypothetical protein
MIYNDEPLTEEERLAAIRCAGTLAGWDDPELDVYEEYREKRGTGDDSAPYDPFNCRARKRLP